MNTDKADFVSPVQSCASTAATLTLRVGETYVARDGVWVTITSRSDGMYPYTGDNGRTYLEHGFEFDGRPGYNESPHDLIALSSDAAAVATQPDELLRDSHDRLKTALERITDLYSDELPVVELSRRMYDARCIALAALESAP